MVNDFFDTLAIYWNAFSLLGQTGITKIVEIATGKELSSDVSHWIFYGILLSIMAFLIQARRAKLRNQLETRQRFDI